MIEGLGVRELVWYMVATEGVMLGGRARIEQETDEEVKTGSIAYLINRPCHYVLFKLAVYWGGDTLLRLITNAVVGSTVALIAVGGRLDLIWRTCCRLRSVRLWRSPSTSSW